MNNYFKKIIIVGFGLLLNIQISCIRKEVNELDVNSDDVYELDFRYKPKDWRSTICLIDDWQKSLVEKDGTLLYDEGVTKINLSISDGKEKWIEQKLESGKIPVVTTLSQWKEIEIKEQAFAITDNFNGKIKPLTGANGNLVQYIDPLRYQRRSIRNFSNPSIICDTVFKNADVAEGYPLIYRFIGANSNEYYFAFGLCEGEFDKPGERIQNISIEEELRETIDMGNTGKNIPFVKIIKARDQNNDGIIDIKVVASKDSRHNGAVVNALWVFKKKPKPDDVLEGKATKNAIAFNDGGTITYPKYNGKPRVDLILVTVRNTESSVRKLNLQVRVETPLALNYDVKNQILSVRNWRYITSSLPIKNVSSGKNSMMLNFIEKSLLPDETYKFVIAVHNGANPSKWTVTEAETCHKNARKYWNNTALPYNVIQVPDSSIQAMLNSCIRNIYQVREIKKGLPAFQVGPINYRDLWIVDGAFILESVTMLGQGKNARAGMDYILSRQKEDGSFEVIRKHWKETGIVLWAVNRHEELTGNKKWLEENWTKVKRAADFIQVLRERSRKDTLALHYGLIPAGYSDGGLEVGSEYTNTYWLLIGLKSAVSMAKRTGRTEQSKIWQKEYDDLWSTFRKLAKRDMYTDKFGNIMLPIPMKRPLEKYPHKAQWAFLHAIYPGCIFENDDPIMRGTLANLEANEKEGLVLGTSWEDETLWTYFGSFMAHAYLQTGQGQKAIQTAYAFANHASPLMVWQEEQRLVDYPESKPFFRGDTPHNWASAEFIRLIAHLLVFERGDELHLFEGLPKSWLKPDTNLEINDIATRFGCFSMKMNVLKDGKTVKLQISYPKRYPPKQIVVHTKSWGKLEKGKAIPNNEGFAITSDTGEEYVLKLK